MPADPPRKTRPQEVRVCRQPPATHSCAIIHSMPKSILGLVCAIVLSLTVMPRVSGQASLSCATSTDPTGVDTDLIREGSSREVQELRRAPHPAIRQGKHTLKVHWQHGEHVFRDRPPFDEPLDGVKWAYCGYNPQLKLHLIGKQNVDVFTGVLLNDSTGEVLQAGETVIFSPDRLLFLAYEQPDGQDGPTIKLYNTDGTLLWKGYDGLLSTDGVSVIAEFQKIQWNAHNQLLAEYTLSGIVHTMILTRSHDGRWHWQPTRPNDR